MGNIIKSESTDIQEFETFERKRWYDRKPYATNVLEQLKSLSIRSHYEISREVIKVVESIKQHNRELVEPPLSIGVTRVLGLYQEQNKRRWYDNSLPISRVFKTASTLQDGDFQNIMQGISVSLSGEDIE